MIYGTEGTQALFTGLATQIVYGGCDHDTADFYSKASGTTTADANPDPQKANFRQRPLLTVDEVVTPQIGNCTMFARYVEPCMVEKPHPTVMSSHFAVVIMKDATQHVPTLTASIEGWSEGNGF